MVDVPVSKKHLPKPLLIMLVVIFFGLAGLIATEFSSCTQAQAAAFCPSIQPQSSDSSIELAPGYLQYSPDNVVAAQATNDKVVLYFWAPWCSSCTSLDQEIQENQADIPDHVTVFRVNYDQADELKKLYNVVTQHTFVQIDDQNQPLATWVGGDIENFAKYLQ